MSDKYKPPQPVNEHELLLAEDVEEAVAIVKAKHPKAKILNISHRGHLTIPYDGKLHQSIGVSTVLRLDDTLLMERLYKGMDDALLGLRRRLKLCR